MGAADFNTSAQIHGTKEEVLAILKVMYAYASEKKEQYDKNRNCPYLTSVYIKGEDEKGFGTRMAPAPDEALLQFIEERNCSIVVEAGGPYGRFGFLDEVDLFLEMAAAAPKASFIGGISGFNPGGDNTSYFELKDGLLYCKYALPTDDDFYEDEDYDDDDFDEEDEDFEPEWTEECVYDPIKKKFIDSKGD